MIKKIITVFIFIVTISCTVIDRKPVTVTFQGEPKPIVCAEHYRVSCGFNFEKCSDGLSHMCQINFKFEEE